MKFGGRHGRGLGVRHECGSRKFEDVGGYLGDRWAEGSSLGATASSCLVLVRESFSGKRDGLMRIELEGRDDMKFENDINKDIVSFSEKVALALAAFDLSPFLSVTI